MWVMAMWNRMPGFQYRFVWTGILEIADISIAFPWTKELNWCGGEGRFTGCTKHVKTRKGGVSWVAGALPTLELVGAIGHEFGHSLGLDHVGDKAAWMYHAAAPRVGWNHSDIVECQRVGVCLKTESKL